MLSTFNSPTRALLAACIALVMTGTLAAQSRAVIVDLGTLGGTRSSAYSVNASGHVVGHSEMPNGDVHAFLYRDGLMIDLGTLGGKSSYAYRINDIGLIIGRSENEDRLHRAFVMLYPFPMIDIALLLGPIIDRQEFSAALGINMRGQIVGYRHKVGDHLTERNRVFRYIDNLVEDLGTFGGEDGVAAAINDAGQIAGSFGLEPHADYANRRAFVTTPDGVGVALGTLGGRVSAAHDINESGEAAGNAQTASGEFHGFVYRQSTLVDIGTLPGGKQSFAYGINRRGDVVGASDSARALRAVVYRNGTLTDLNSQLPSGSGWVLSEARAINNAGQIVGTGVVNGQQHAFLFTPPR